MASKRKRLRHTYLRNVYLQTLIYEIIKSAGKPIQITEIFQKLTSEYSVNCTRRTVARNIEMMMSDYKLLCVNENGINYEKDYIKHLNGKRPRDDKWTTKTKFFTANPHVSPVYSIDLNLPQIQVLLWSLLNLGQSSTNFFDTLTQDTKNCLLEKLPHSNLGEVKQSMRLFTRFDGVFKKPFSFRKNNLLHLLQAIREKKWITAKVKDHKLDFKGRHIERKLAIGSITFKNNIPYVIAYDSEDDEYKSIRATRLNSIKILDKLIPQKIFKYIREYEVSHNKQRISIKCKGILAQIFKESEVSSTQEIKSDRDKDIIKVEFNMRISNSFVNLLLPHTRDIISLSPKSLKDELLLRTQENLKNLKSF